MTSVSIFLQRIKAYPALFSFLAPAIFISSICFAFIPRWTSNDDAAMSMIAHGYGLAAYGSPHLIFSNVLWGYMVRAIPSINGVLGYSLATIAVLLVAGWAMLYFLIRLGAGYIASLFAVFLLIALPTLTPQFTINAGLLTVAAIIGFQVYARLGGVGNLWAACLLAFIGYLIRDMAFLLVLVVASPLLPWRILLKQRQMQIALLLLTVAIASAAAFDSWSYSAPQWQSFMKLNSARVPFTDYGANHYLKQHPEILARQGYSQNDVDLVNDWFFVDPKIADPKSLNAMLSELGPLSLQKGGILSGLAAIKTLASWTLLPLFLSAIILLVLMPCRPAVLAWVLCLVALFTIGIMGRPGIMRLYVISGSLLLLAPFMVGTYKDGIRQWAIALILFLACIANVYVILPNAIWSKQWAQQVRMDIHDLPISEPIVSWGADFPFELAFPVLSNDLDSRNIKFYGLDSFTHAPFSVANTEQMAGRGMLERLQSSTGIAIFASPQKLAKLQIYCREHMQGQLSTSLSYQTMSLMVQRAKCETVK